VCGKEKEGMAGKAETAEPERILLAKVPYVPRRAVGNFLFFTRGGWLISQADRAGTEVDLVVTRSL
jgi:hypothetical protein